MNSNIKSKGTMLVAITLATVALSIMASSIQTGKAFAATGPSSNANEVASVSKNGYNSNQRVMTSV